MTYNRILDFTENHEVHADDNYVMARQEEKNIEPSSDGAKFQNVYFTIVISTVLFRTF